MLITKGRNFNVASELLWIGWTQIYAEINKTYTGPSPPPPPHDCIETELGEPADQSEAKDGGGDQ